MVDIARCALASDKFGVYLPYLDDMPENNYIKLYWKCESDSN